MPATSPTAKCAAVGLGAALGALARWALTSATPTSALTPVATLAINLLGCYLMGVLARHLHPQRNELVVLALTTGALGGFTTFSTFSLDTWTLLRQGKQGIGLVYLVTTLVGCPIAAWLGLRPQQRDDLGDDL